MIGRAHTQVRELGATTLGEGDLARRPCTEQGNECCDRSRAERIVRTPCQFDRVATVYFGNDPIPSFRARVVTHFDASPSHRAGHAEDSSSIQADVEEAHATEVLATYAEAFPARMRAAVVAHVTSTVCPEPHFGIRLAAMQALVALAERLSHGDVRARSRPANQALGDWIVCERGASIEVAIASLDPIRVSCACAPFARSSLGMCVHSLAALMRVRRDAWSTRPRARARPTLRWDAVEPLSGDVDRLARLRVIGATLPGTLGGAPSPLLLRSPKGRLTMIAAFDDAAALGYVHTEPAVRTVLDEERARAALALGSETHLHEARHALDRLRRPLYPYQREGVLRFLERGRLLLADDMGLGKTTQAIACAHALFATSRIARGLLVVPTSLKPRWRREWLAVTDVPLTLVEGTPDERAAIYRTTTHGTLMVGYEQLLRDIASLSHWSPELVVLDEAQRIKNDQTKTARFVKTLAPAYRLALTGTPLENRLGELASLAEFVDDLALEPTWRLIARHTFEEGDADQGISGVCELGALRARMAPIFLRRVRRDVIAQLPARTDTRIPVKMTIAQAAAHHERETATARLLQIAKRRGLRREEHERLMRLFTEQRIICNGMAQLDFESAWAGCEDSPPTLERLESMHTPKLAALRALIEDLCVVQRRKVVVFSQWRRMLRLGEWAVRDLVERTGLRTAFFTGAESPKLRERALVDFHDDPAVAALLLTDAGGVGLNQQRAASACIQLELPWNPAIMEQRVGHIHRLGQRKPIDTFHLVSEDGIESRIADIVGHKRALFTGLFDGTSDEIRFEGGTSFVERLRTIALPAVEAPAREDAETTGVSGSDLVTSHVAPPQRSAAPPQPFEITTRPDGGIRIDVAPEHAGPLASVLSALALALRSQNGRPADAHQEP